MEEHFKVRLNTSFPHNREALNDLNNLVVYHEIDDSEITIEEIRKAINKMKSKKAPSFDFKIFIIYVIDLKILKN